MLKAGSFVLFWAFPHILVFLVSVRLKERRQPRRVTWSPWKKETFSDVLPGGRSAALHTEKPLRPVPRRSCHCGVKSLGLG